MINIVRNIFVLKFQFFLLQLLYDCNLFCAKYKYTSLKYGLFECLALISFPLAGKFVLLNTFLVIIFNISYKSACSGKYLCTKFLLSTSVCNSGDSCRYFFLDHSYTSLISPTCCGTFSSKSVFMSGSVESTYTGPLSIQVVDIL